ncbi:waprin-Enh1-like [Ambystoma mexicanum]|uniref:waprin-Enh1-like n=1 Tax=Ambystoma mexicanum TaxID=8296 RepID=UPI0037E9455E
MKTTLALLLLVGLLALSAVPPSEADDISDHRGTCPRFYGGPENCYKKEIKCRGDYECKRDEKCCDASKCLRKCMPAERPADHRGTCPRFYGGPENCYKKEIKCRGDYECERDEKCCDASKCLRKCMPAERPGDYDDHHGHDHHDDHNDHHDDHNDHHDDHNEHHDHGDDCPRLHPENCYRMKVKCRDSKGCPREMICCNLPNCIRDCVRRDTGGYHH